MVHSAVKQVQFEQLKQLKLPSSRTKISPSHEKPRLNTIPLRGERVLLPDQGLAARQSQERRKIRVKTRTGGAGASTRRHGSVSVVTGAHAIAPNF